MSAMPFPLLPFELTVSLNRVMSDTTQHRKSRIFTETESFPHPGEEVRQTVMSALDTLGNTSTARSEREGGRRVGTENDTSSGRFELLEWGENILFPGSRAGHARLVERNRRYKKAEGEVLLDEIGNGWGEGAGRGDDEERSRTRDLEIDCLSVGWVCRVCHQQCSSFATPYTL
jgi:hypothetical protein